MNTWLEKIIKKSNLDEAAKLRLEMMACVSNFSKAELEKTIRTEITTKDSKSATTQYFLFFPHTNKKDRKRGKEGFAGETARIAYHTAQAWSTAKTKEFKALFDFDYYIFSEAGTGIVVTIKELENAKSKAASA